MLPPRNSNLAWKKIGPYFVIIDPVKSKQIFSLNEVGQFIWNCCDGDHSLEECVDKLYAIYDSEYESLKRDVEQFVQTLVEQGVLVECS